MDPAKFRAARVESFEIRASVLSPRRAGRTDVRIALNAVEEGLMLLERSRPMATEWKVEGTGLATKINANCPKCHARETLCGDEPLKVVDRKFKHTGCEGYDEPLPPEILELYWQRAVVSQC
jgi:hypothetical protein